MKKPNKIYRSLGPSSRMGVAFRSAHYHPAPSLRSAFRGVEWMLAGTFSGATLCKFWVQRFMATLNQLHLPYRGRKLSTLFSMIAGLSRKRHEPTAQPQPRFRPQ
ncbi:MAG: hypothetical protein PHX61_14450 [Alphaproteobacteria bacterium]|nr:hypothetical protein [Alphaproteobacteria bacterium]